MVERRSPFGPDPLDRESKACSGCKLIKPLDEFGPDRHRADGRTRYCRPCLAERQRAWAARNKASVRATRFKKKYGLSVEDYEKLARRAGGKCEACGGSIPHHLGDEADLRAKVAIDHDHATGAIRGLLCAPCNCAIGYMFDDPARLRAAADYLERKALLGA